MALAKAVPVSMELSLYSRDTVHDIYLIMFRSNDMRHCSSQGCPRFHGIKPAISNTDGHNLSSRSHAILKYVDIFKIESTIFFN